MSIAQLQASLLAVGIVRVQHNHNRRGQVLLAPCSVWEDNFSLAVPTHWDVQEATSGFQEGALRKSNPMLQFNIAELGYGRFSVTVENDGLTFFLTREGETHTEPEFCTQYPLDNMTSVEVITWYTELRERVLRYCERPGIPLDADMRAQFKIYSRW